MKVFKMTLVAAAVAVVVAPMAHAAATEFDNFTPMIGNTTPLNPARPHLTNCRRRISSRKPSRIVRPKIPWFQAPTQAVGT